MVESSQFRAGLMRGRVALVTGGGSGLGKALARELLSLGCDAVIASQQVQRAQTAVLAATHLCCCFMLLMLFAHGVAHALSCCCSCCVMLLTLQLMAILSPAHCSFTYGRCALFGTPPAGTVHPLSLSGDESANPYRQPCGVCRVVISLDTPIALCEQERSFLCPSTRLTRQAGGNQAWPVGKRK
jgi:hypothetical protein